MVRPSVNELWIQRESVWCEEANPFCLELDRDGKMEPMISDDLPVSSPTGGTQSFATPSCSGRSKGRQSTPPPPRSGVLQVTKERIAVLDLGILDIMKERELAYQRTRSAIDRIEALASGKRSGPVLEQQDAKAKGSILELPPGAVPRREPPSSVHQEKRESRKDLASAQTASSKKSACKENLDSKNSLGKISPSPNSVPSRSPNSVPSRKSFFAAHFDGNDHLQDVHCKNATKLPGSPFIQFPSTPITVQTQRSPRLSLPGAKRMHIPLRKVSTPSHPECFASSAAQLHERLLSRGILAIG